MGDPSILADEIRVMCRKVGRFEIINNAGFETENLFGKLIHEEERGSISRFGCKARIYI